MISQIQNGDEEMKNLILQLQNGLLEKEEVISELRSVAQERSELISKLHYTAEEQRQLISKLQNDAQERLELIYKLENELIKKQEFVDSFTRFYYSTSSLNFKQRSRLFLQNKLPQRLLKKIIFILNRLKPLKYLWELEYPPMPLKIPRHYQTNAIETASLPTVCIVTPSFNQGHFIERTIKSVIEQSYPEIEYIIQDGGSKDGTVEILEKYRSNLSHVESRKDKGQTNAINCGFNHASGEIMAYLNSDDLLLPGTISYVVNFFLKNPDVDVVYGHRIIVNENDDEIGRWVLPPHDEENLLWADYIPQETMFWRRRIWEKVGGSLDESFQYAMDWDLLLRFQKAGANFVRLPRFLGAFRVHSAQKTSAWLDIGLQEMARLRRQSHGRCITEMEAGYRVKPFLKRFNWHYRLYRLGIFRY
jgi:glycosyltransferase involved in cell wall biosynthesis